MTENKPIEVRMILLSGDDLYEEFQFLSKESGVTSNVQVTRNAIKIAAEYYHAKKDKKTRGSK
jgi:hypothetical protein